MERKRLTLVGGAGDAQRRLEDQLQGQSSGPPRWSPWAWLKGQVQEERGQWILWSPVALAGGMGIYFALPAEPPWAAVIAPLALVLGLLWLSRRQSVAFYFLLAVSLVLAGLGLAKLRSWRVAAPVLTQQWGPADVIGRVLVRDSLPNGGQRLVIAVESIAGLAPDARPARARVTLRMASMAMLPGDDVRLYAVLGPPPGPAAPGAFDFARAAYFERLGAVGYAVARPQRLAQGNAGDFALFIARQRAALATQIGATLPSPAGGLAAALLVGDRSAIDAATQDAFRDAGLAHLLAISGLHMGLVAALIFASLRALLAAMPWVALHWPLKAIAGAGAWLGTLGYLLIAGAPVPTQRAFIMMSLVLAAVILGRQPFSLRLAALASALILVLAPEEILSVSFQMSFAAVIALIAAYEGLRPRLTALAEGRQSVVRRAGLYLLGVALSTVVAELAIAPIAAFHFNRIAAYGLAANMLAVPLTAFWVMPWGLLALALTPLGLGHWALLPMGWGLEALAAIARDVASAPGAVLLVPALPMATLVLMALGGLWLCLWRRRWRWGGLAPIILGVVLGQGAPRPDILIAADGKLLALRGEDGALRLSSRRGSRITRDTWLRRNAQEAAATWREDNAFTESRRLNCDELGCVFGLGPLSAAGALLLVAQSLHPAALVEDCRRADILITPLNAPDCHGPQLVIDAAVLTQKGGHALGMVSAKDTEHPRLRVASVHELRGRRPWVWQRAPQDHAGPANDAGERDDGWPDGHEGDGQEGAGDGFAQ
ncbi:MAG: ComEC/Rec2 family competence protein [Pseudomonadota bacterium]